MFWPKDESGHAREIKVEKMLLNLEGLGSRYIMCWKVVGLSMGVNLSWRQGN